ncbi:MAG TPA: hypothetical protein DEO87_02075 [Lachnospiraceae bacterium]|nr:hypothetical protein [Lachnospiraceae bacterium]
MIRVFFTENTDFDVEKILIPDTPERNAFYSDMDKLMYKHFTEYHKLNNLLWVWNCPLKEGYL